MIRVAISLVAGILVITTENGQIAITIDEAEALAVTLDDCVKEMSTP